MTINNEEPAAGRKRSRFVIQDDEIEVSGHRIPSAEERDEADRVFDRILKKRKP